MANRIPPGKICYKCGKDAKRRERNAGVETGKYICISCYHFRYKYGTYEKPKKQYNDENRCEFIESNGKRCSEQLYPSNARRFKIYEKFVWFCKMHGNRYYQKYDHNSQNNIIKSIANCRTNNENPNHPSTKGNKYVHLACILYGYIDLNKKYDNYKSPIDCQDPMTGLLYQIQGRCYNSEDRDWNFASLEYEWHKEYADIICFCKSKDGKTIERIYRFPSWEIIGKIAITIYINKNDHWYDKYRVCEDEIKKANEIWEIINNP